MTYGDLDTFAFNLCNNNELLNINLRVPYQKAPVSEKSKDRQFSNLCDKEIDNNLPSKTCCKNYSINEFQTLKINNTHLKIFHNNTNRLETKHDLLQIFLANNTINFDIIAITETSLKTGNVNFKTKIDLEGYKSFLYLQITTKEVPQSI